MISEKTIRVPENHTEIKGLFYVVGTVNAELKEKCTKCDANNTAGKIEYLINSAMHLGEKEGALDFLVDNPLYQNSKDYYAKVRAGGIFNGLLTGFQLEPIPFDDTTGDPLSNMITYKRFFKFGGKIKPDYLYAFNSLISLKDMSDDEYHELLHTTEELQQSQGITYSLCGYELQLVEGDIET